ncbi:outer membrane autotransporter protein [Herbaspirillum sp. Sphag1AN]|nr:outer membrane autotransporter protein [Herbaspirillum sp. Sphag1AN]MBB3244133.1 outer membrane autotransporter protein [Herbaspirillum sp. Sphag64]
MTLTGNNTYTGGTTISAGTLQIGNGGTSGAIVGNITDNATLSFDRSDNITYAGTITGSGTLIQAGTGVTTLSGASSSVGNVNVAAGTLNLAPAVSLATTGNYTTANGATTALTADATLNVGGAFIQAAGSTLDVALDVTQPVITAATADLEGTLTITGLSGTPDTASALEASHYTLIHTTGGISSNNFSNIDLGGAASSVDYITLTAGKSANTLDYNIGFDLTWQAGPTLGNGTFTLANPGDSFNVDVALTNEAASATGWDGHTLTKNGAGTLILSAANTYTGATEINAGTLQAGIANAFADSSAVNVAPDATLDLNNFNQTANNLTGAGNVTLGTATLIANNTADTNFAGIISGTGGLTKTGTNTLTLSGNSSAVGNVNVTGGTLNLAQSGNFSTTNDYVTGSGATTLLGANATLSIGGALTQANGSTLGVVVAGIQPLITANTASLGGTLEVTSIGSTLASTLIDTEFYVIHTVGGITNDFSTVSFGGAATGVDFLSVAGSKSSNGLDYNLSFGLIWDSGNSEGNGVFTLKNPGDSFTVNVPLADQSNSATGWTGNTLTKDGPGTLVLAAANTYTGATNIMDGTLQTGVINAFMDSNVINVAKGATLNLNNFNQIANNLGGAGNVALGNAVLDEKSNTDTTFSGIISGAGEVIKDGPNNLTLTGNNNYAGGTIISDGTLTAHTASLGSGAITDNAALVIDEPGTASLSDAINGTGSLTKTDVGTLTLTATNAVSGMTTVAAGVLAVNGSLNNSTVQVLNGAELEGSGSVGATTVASGGKIATGSPTTTLTINGNLTEQAGAIYNAQVDPTSTHASLINVNGNAILQPGAELQVTRSNRALYVQGNEYNVLKASGDVEGTFTLTGDINTEFTTLVATYDANDVYLIVEQDQSFNNVGATPNQINVATSLQGLAAGNLLREAVANLETAAQAQNAFDQLSGELHATLNSQFVEESHFVTDAAIDRLRQVFSSVGGAHTDINTNDTTQEQPSLQQMALSSYNPHTPQPWIRAFGAWGSTGGNGNAAEASRSVGGLFAGTDVEIGNEWRVGAMTGYSSSSIDVDDRSSSANSNDYYLGIYGGKQWDDVILRAGASYTRHSISTERSVNFPGYSDQLNASYDGNTTQAFGELGYRIDQGNVQYEPFVNLTIIRQSSDSFIEHGNLAALQSDSASMNTSFSTLGVRAASKFMVDGIDWTAHGMLGWRHAYGDLLPSSQLTLTGSTPFTVAGVPVASDAAVLQLGVEAPVAKNASFSVSYTGLTGNGLRDSALHAALRWAF